MSCILSTVEEHDSQADSVPIPPPIPDPRFAFLILCGIIAIERFAFYLLFSLFTLYLLTMNRTGSRCDHRVRPVHLDHVFRPFGRWLRRCPRRTLAYHPLRVLLLAIGYLALESVCPSLFPSHSWPPEQVSSKATSPRSSAPYSQS